jgi:hypothetical protein
VLALLLALIAAAGSAIRSPANLAIENLVLRQQLAVLRHRHNTWRVYDLDHLSKSTATEKLAAIEIAALRA